MLCLHGSPRCGVGGLSSSSYCKPTSSRPGRSHLRSATSDQLNFPRTQTDYGKRSFAVNGPVVWNRFTCWVLVTWHFTGRFQSQTFLFNCWLSAFGVFILILRSTNALNNNNNNYNNNNNNNRDLSERNHQNKIRRETTGQNPTETKC